MKILKLYIRCTSFLWGNIFVLIHFCDVSIIIQKFRIFQWCWKLLNIKAFSWIIDISINSVEIMKKIALFLAILLLKFKFQKNIYCRQHRYLFNIRIGKLWNMWSACVACRVIPEKVHQSQTFKFNFLLFTLCALMILSFFWRSFRETIL